MAIQHSTTDLGGTLNGWADAFGNRGGRHANAYVDGLIDALDKRLANTSLLPINPNHISLESARAIVVAIERAKAKGLV